LVQDLLTLLQPGQALGDLSPFAKAYGTDLFCKRLLRKYQGNLQKCSDKFKQALTWRDQHKELLMLRNFAPSSDYRVIGADLGSRPVLYGCVKNQILSSVQCYDQMVVRMLQAIDNMPPGVETAVHVWDLHGMRFRFSDMNPSTYVQMASSVEAYFAERMHMLIIVEMPRLAGFLKDAVWPLVSEKTKSKVKFMTLEQAREYLRATCDAEASNRIFAAMEENRNSRLSLEERRSNWMRVSVKGELVPAFLMEPSPTEELG